MLCMLCMLCMLRRYICLERYLGSEEKGAGIGQGQIDGLGCFVCVWVIYLATYKVRLTFLAEG